MTTEKKCSHCKETKRLEDFPIARKTATGRGAYCRPCAKIRHRKWQIKNRSKIRALDKKYRDSKKDCPEYRKRQKLARDRFRSTPKGILLDFRSWLRSAYDIGLTEYERLYFNQQGRCAICDGKPDGERPLAVDHCHKTGKVRGLLCQRCNHGLGHFRDNLDLLSYAKNYLLSFPDAHN